MTVTSVRLKLAAYMYNGKFEHIKRMPKAKIAAVGAFLGEAELYCLGMLFGVEVFLASATNGQVPYNLMSDSDFTCSSPPTPKFLASVLVLHASEHFALAKPGR